MFHGDLKLYWLRIQYNKWQCGVFSSFLFLYKTVFSNTIGVLAICHFAFDMALKYNTICTSNPCKGRVSGRVYESLRRETFFVRVKRMFSA